MQELIKFAMTHEGAKQVNLLDSVVAHTISPSSDGSQGLALKDRESVSSLFLEVRISLQLCTLQSIYHLHNFVHDIENFSFF